MVPPWNLGCWILRHSPLWSGPRRQHFSSSMIDGKYSLFLGDFVYGTLCMVRTRHQPTKKCGAVRSDLSRDPEPFNLWFNIVTCFPYGMSKTGKTHTHTHMQHIFICMQHILIVHNKASRKSSRHKYNIHTPLQQTRKTFTTFTTNM